MTSVETEFVCSYKEFCDVNSLPGSSLNLLHRLLTKF